LGINAIYGNAYKEHTPEWTQIFKKYTSSKAYEEDVGSTGFGLLSTVGEGESVSYDKAEQGFVKRYTHVKYGLGFIITQEMFEDNQYQGAMINRPESLAFSVHQTMETIAANVLNRAFTSTYTGADGVELCSTLHRNKSGGTYSNELATAADLSESSLEQMVIDIGKYTNDRGLKIRVVPQKLVVAVDLEHEAIRILKSALQNDTANNAINALRASGSFPGGIVVNHYLTDADAFFAITDCPHGLKYFERKKPTFAMEDDWDTDNAKFKAIFRGAWGWTDPRGIHGSPGA
jgi:hypothetical protein